MPRSLFVTDTARREQSRHRLLNCVYDMLAKEDIEFNILAFGESQGEPILSEVGLKVPAEGTARALSKRSSPFIFWRRLTSYAPDHLIIGGYGFKENWLALFYGLLRRLPITFWTGAGTKTTESNSILRFCLKRLFVRFIDSAVTYGSNAKNYLVSLGVNEDIIHCGVNVSDLSLFKRTLKKHFNSDEMKVNTEGLPKPILVFVGRFEPVKGVELLLEQLMQLPRDQYHCYFIGKGSLLKVIQETIETGKVSGEVLGFLKQSEVAKRLVESDVYVLPSLNDPFTRTLSEALAAGCFVLNSKFDDASFDLVEAGKNGFVFDPSDADEFKRYLQMVVNPQWKRPCRNQISEGLSYSTDLYASQIVGAVMHSMALSKN